MYNSKLLEVLKVFLPSEFKELDFFLDSPLFDNKNNQLKQRQLLHFIQKTAPTFEANSLTKEFVYKVVFPGKSIVKGKLEKLMTDLLDSIRRYLHWKFYQQSENLALKWKPEVAFYKERKLKNLHELTLERKRRENKKGITHDQDKYWEGLNIAEAQTNFSQQFEPEKLSAVLTQQEEALDQYYLLKKLQIAVSRLAQKIQKNERYINSLIDLSQLLEIIAPDKIDSLPAHRIYMEAASFLNNYDQADLSAFENLKRILDDEGEHLPQANVKMLRTLLRIFATARYNRGDHTYLNFAHEMYQDHLEKGYLYYDGKIHSLTLLNIVILGLRCKVYDRVFSMLNGHQHKIIDNHNSNQIYEFNLALYHFHQNNFELASNLIADHYENLYYQLNARRLEIMIYYEQKSVLLESKMEAFKVYVFRKSKKEMPEIPRISNNHFIDILRQIIQPKTLGNAVRVQKLVDKLANLSSVAERDWLAIKLKEL